MSVTEPFDTTTPQGRLLLHLVSAFSEFERQVLIDRVRSGLAAAKRRGRVGGRPKAGVDAVRALELRAAGRTIPQVAAELGAAWQVPEGAAQEPRRTRGRATLDFKGLPKPGSDGSETLVCELLGTLSCATFRESAPSQLARTRTPRTTTARVIPSCTREWAG
ncbi:MAG: recombinase family protein [Myxococcota bacterium]